MKVSLLPMTSSSLPKKNLQIVLKVIEELDSEVDLLCLPENSLLMNLGKEPIPKDQALHRDHPVIEELQKACAKKKLHLHLGGIPWLIEGDVYNEALIINDAGEVKETYEKTHLFDVHLAPGIEIKESRSYRPGLRLNTFTVKGWKLATCICYDLRFAELFVHYLEKEQVDMFLVPAAFTVKTGRPHWKTLLQARAIETQCFVVAPAQVGWHGHKPGEKLRKSWGQSLAFGPWGDCLGEGESFDDFLDSWTDVHKPITFIAKKEDIEGARRAIPMSQHRVFAMELKKND